MGINIHSGSKVRKSDVVMQTSLEIFRLAKELDVPGAATLDDPTMLQMVLAQLEKKQLLIIDDEPLVQKHGKASGFQAAQSVAVEKIFVSYPPHGQLMAGLDGKTVQQVYDQVADMFSMHEKPLCFVNARQVQDFAGTTVKAGDRVEFTKPAGAKGL